MTSWVCVCASQILATGTAWHVTAWRSQWKPTTQCLGDLRRAIIAECKQLRHFSQVNFSQNSSNESQHIVFRNEDKRHFMFYHLSMISTWYCCSWLIFIPNRDRWILGRCLCCWRAWFNRSLTNELLGQITYKHMAFSSRQLSNTFAVVRKWMCQMRGEGSKNNMDRFFDAYQFLFDAYPPNQCVYSYLFHEENGSMK